MQDDIVLAYVIASARFLGLTLDDAAAARVAGHLGRTATMAAQLEAFDLGVEDEPVALFCPAAFPTQGEPA